MKHLHFNIEYHTANGDFPEIAYAIDGNEIDFTPLCSTDNQHWHVCIEVPDASKHIRYAYQIKNSQNLLIRTEANSWRMFLFNHRTDVCFFDAWTEQSLSEIYHRSAFEKSIMAPRGGEKLHMDLFTSPCLLLVHALPPAEGMKWAVVGNTRNFGEWNERKARVLQRTGTYEWALPLTREDFEQGVEYKYIMVGADESHPTIWEEGGNRQLIAQPYPQTASAVRQDEMPRIALDLWKGAGCVIPVFSLRSEGSMGVGDFGDLRKMVRWAAETGMKAVQLLPINDTTRSGSWHDSYPYSGISVFALHPLYLDLREWRDCKAFKAAKAQGGALNALPALNYEEAFKLKMTFAHALYKECGAKICASADYKVFVNDNAHWLPAYTAFSALRDFYHTADFRSWPEGTTFCHIEEIEKKHPEIAKARAFYAWLQFLLHRQMLCVHNEARALGVILKGDIPIGISRDSVPAWVDGHLFHFNGQAGAPPDAFATHGQNWGFPTYNWHEMAKDGYQWWRARLQHMEQYFDAYRIDHVLGFFRIWEVPSNQIYGLLGQFRPALPFTQNEIRNWGFQADIEAYSVPRVSDEQMQLFIDETGDANFAAHYFDKDEHGYVLKTTYRSQRKVAQMLPEGKIRQILFDIACEVLFVRDATNSELFHPRVSAQLTQVFQQLSAHDREVFNHLHDNFFYERNNQFWADEAMKKIPAVTQSPDSLSPSLRLYPIGGQGMLACAEDLGMVPASVKGVLDRLRILSLEIQRMPKEYGVRFGNLAHNPYLSVATIATHDMPPLRLWWTENSEQTQAFWHEALHHTSEVPAEATPSVCEEVINQHLQSPSMLCLLALQDWLAISAQLRSPHPEQEQINVPSNPNQYWQYRMHLTIENLIQATGFNNKVRDMIKMAGR